MKRNAKRGALAVFASATAAVASLAMLPASPALAADATCKSFTAGGVSFSLCTERVTSTRGRARIIVTAGTYVSGTLYLLAPGFTYPGCSGKIYAGNECSFSETWGSTTYKTQWHAGSNVFSTAGLYIS